MKKFELKNNTHIILKVEHLNELFDNKEYDELAKSIMLLSERKKLNGYKESDYYICNKDEHYAQDVFNLIKEKIMLRDVVKCDFISLGDDGTCFAIERKVFDELFNEMDAMRPTYSGFDEEELMKLLLIDWYEEQIGDTPSDVEVSNWHYSIEKPQYESMDDETYFEKCTKEEGKHYTIYFNFNLR